MSDATNHGETDFRGNRETKRRDETVMLGSDSIASMVQSAKAEPAAPAPGAPVAAAAVDEASSGTRLIILATGAIVILLVVVALVYSWVS